MLQPKIAKRRAESSTSNQQNPTSFLFPRRGRKSVVNYWNLIDFDDENEFKTLPPIIETKLSNQPNSLVVGTGCNWFLIPSLGVLGRASTGKTSLLSGLLPRSNQSPNPNYDYNSDSMATTTTTTTTKNIKSNQSSSKEELYSKQGYGIDLMLDSANRIIYLDSLPILSYEKYPKKYAKKNVKAFNKKMALFLLV